jgi:hypothetical protein
LVISDENNRIGLGLYLSMMVKRSLVLGSEYILVSISIAGTKPEKIRNILEPDHFIAKGHAEKHTRFKTLITASLK